MTNDGVVASAPRLVLSFWDLCLDNIPVGKFERRHLPICEARALIDAARAAGQLHCVTSKDIVAPYGVKHLHRYRELCALLESEFGIELKVEEFTTPSSLLLGMRCINPLECVQLAGRDKILIATCQYSLSCSSGDVSTAGLFSLEADSLRFHLITALGDTNQS